jgi:tetratricopeptide (TPR) repeat protein
MASAEQSIPGLEPPDSHYVSAAVGWSGLGNYEEAELELSRVGAANRAHPDVLEVKWFLLARVEKWEEALEVAQKLVQCAPGRSFGWLHRAYSLRRTPAGGVKKAWEALLPAFDRFPKESIICFNLSCYACQMKQLEAARVWFKRALIIGGKEKIKEMGLSEPDLEPLWKEIKSI